MAADDGGIKIVLVGKEYNKQVIGLPEFPPRGEIRRA